ncbi:MAG: hypothetical protein FJ029_13515 [Actinobacteria bacterium]|nr:hypothetical protein [Actinomycetota bacterium]
MRPASGTFLTAFGVCTGALLAVGCLAGPHAYLSLSGDYRLPAEYADAATYLELHDTWLRTSPLGLEGAVGAVLEDPVLGSALIAFEASRSKTPGGPGQAAAEAWDRLYRGGERLPVRVRWRFNKHFHEEHTISPDSGWKFSLTDDRGLSLQPVEIGKMSASRDARDWLGEFRLWFPRSSIDGRRYMTNRTRTLTLTIVGVPGDTSLTWRFLPLLDAPDAGTLQ